MVLCVSLNSDKQRLPRSELASFSQSTVRRSQNQIRCRSRLSMRVMGLITEVAHHFTIRTTKIWDLRNRSVQHGECTLHDAERAQDRRERLTTTFLSTLTCIQKSSHSRRA